MANSNIKLLKEIREKNGNNVCADCNDSYPEWTSLNLGIFLCTRCATMHRGLGVHLSKVKSLSLDNWDREQVEAMENIGNKVSNNKFLQYVPSCYPCVHKDSPDLIREQYIRAKYERLEFMNVDRQIYLRDVRIGNLWKLGRENNKFLSRRFELHVRENQLAYYTKDGPNKAPKESIPLDDINCVFVPEKMGNLNGMQISYPKNGVTRNIFLYAEDAKEIMDWYLAIRNAKLLRLRIGLPNMSVTELKQRLTRDFTLEGWLYKTGPNPGDKWRKRWFSLVNRKLLYFDEPLAAFSNGEIYIGTKEDDFTVHDGVPTWRKSRPHSFTLNVPGRDYPMAAEDEDTANLWKSTLKALIHSELNAVNTTCK